MKAIEKILAYLLFLTVFATGVKAQDVISAEVLVSMMKDPNTLIISTRKPADYAKVHVLGAINLMYSSLNGDMAMLLPAEQIAQKLGDHGISDSRNIVIYDHGSGTAAGRMFWTLKYLGAENVKILDGGMPTWIKQRRPVSQTVPEVAAVEFKLTMHPEYFATMKEVKKATNSKDYIIVDARSSTEYDGTRADKSLSRTGHIPSAININFVNVFDEDGLLKPKKELASLFAEHGITKDKKVIVYCKTSVRAGVLFHVLSSALDYPEVKVYDGAFLQWQHTASNKVVR